jgi:hypothetical protein
LKRITSKQGCSVSTYLYKRMEQKTIMTQSNQHLTGYSLKLSTDDRRKIKLAAAVSGYMNLYEWSDAAVQWAEMNKDSIRPISNKKNGKYSSYYLKESNQILMQLETHWDCSTTRALYTAINEYLNKEDP